MLLLKLDHATYSPESDTRQWPSATLDLTKLLQASADEAAQKLLFAFVLRTLRTLDEECVERFQERTQVDQRASNNVKDTIRSESITTYISVF